MLTPRERQIIDELVRTVDETVRTLYPTPVNDMSLGEAFAYSRIESEAKKRSKKVKDAIKAGTTGGRDTVFEAELTERAGSQKIDPSKLRLELGVLLGQHDVERGQAVQIIERLIADCTVLGAGSTAVSIKERDDAQQEQQRRAESTKVPTVASTPSRRASKAVSRTRT